MFGIFGKGNIMISKPNQTLETWESYCAENSVYSDPIGYLEATLTVVSDIDEMLLAAKTFKELKENLGLYIKDRYDFYNNAKTLLNSGSYKNHPLYIEDDVDDVLDFEKHNKSYSPDF